MPQPMEHPTVSRPAADLALRVLRLERQLSSYQRLHAEELAELGRALAQVQDEMLALALRSTIAQPGGEALET